MASEKKIAVDGTILHPSEDGYLFLMINTGSTSTKVGIYRDMERLVAKAVRYDSAELERRFKTIRDQRELRVQGILDCIAENGYSMSDFDAVITRGAIVRPVPSGPMLVTEGMIADGELIGGFHPVSLGLRVAKELADEAGIPCVTADPSSTDELCDEARYSGFPEIQRVCQYQPLNHERIARLWAADHGKRYEDLNLVIAHMGGGTTVGAHRYGRCIDVNEGNRGEGPMTPERPGTVPLVPVIEECFSGKYTLAQMVYRVYHGGGIKAYLGTSDLQEVERRALEEGDENAKGVLDAFIYQVAKEIGAMCAVLCGEVDAIILTGGVAYSDYIVTEIRRRVGKWVPVDAYPGEDELGALASNILRYLHGECELMEYDDKAPYVGFDHLK
ncbi:MAG: butyrate kinase [Atopobiaceae bacterium]|nr:butyrate kinase [Atopobiaceae bacterium]